MTIHVVGTFPIGGINLAASTALSLGGPILGEVDAMMASLGLTAADLSIQFNASINVQLQFALQLENPFVTIEMTLASLANISASLSASLGLSIPTPQIAAQLASAAVSAAAFGLQLGLLQAVIAAALAAKLPFVDFIADLATHLAAGPVVVASWGFAASPEPLEVVGTELDVLFSSGIGSILPTDNVYGVLLVTSSPSASAAIAATLLVT